MDRTNTGNAFLPFALLAAVYVSAINRIPHFFLSVKMNEKKTHTLSHTHTYHSYHLNFVIVSDFYV